MNGGTQKGMPDFFVIPIFFDQGYILDSTKNVTTRPWPENLDIILVGNQFDPLNQWHICDIGKLVTPIPGFSSEIFSPGKPGRISYLLPV